MANVKQKMPKGNAGATSTNPSPTAGSPAAIKINSTTSDAGQNARVTVTMKNPAKGNDKNGDYSTN